MRRHMAWSAAWLGCLALLAGLSLLAVSCAERIDAPPRPDGVRVRAPLKADLYQRVVLTVSGPDMSLIVVNMQQVGLYLQADVVIPSGPDRLFVIEVIGLDGRLVYRGETVMNVLSGLASELTIDLLPARPVLRVTPHFGEVAMDSTVTVDVELRGISGVGVIGFNLHITPTNQNLQIASVRPHAALDTLYDFTTWISDESNTSAWIQVSCQASEVCDRVAPLGDGGHTALATVVLTSQDDWGAAAQDFELSFTVRTLQNTLGVAIPGDSLYADRSVVSARKTKTREMAYDRERQDDAGLTVVEPAPGAFLIGGYMTVAYKAVLPTDADAGIFYASPNQWGGGFGVSGTRYYGFGYIEDLCRPGGDASYCIGSSTGDGWHQYLARVDPRGYGLWSVSGPWGAYGRGVVAAPGGCVTVADVPSSEQILLGRYRDTGSSGVLVWNRSYGGAPGRYSVQALVARGNAGFAFCGAADTLGTADRDFYVCAVDTGGSFLWRQLRGGPGDDIANDVVVADDGGLVIVGARTNGSERDGCMFKFDAAGTVRWERIFDGTGDAELNAVIRAPAGGYLAVGGTKGPAGDRDVLVIRTDDSGELIWRRTFGGSSDDCARDVVATTDGEYMIVGDTRPLGADEDLYLLKIDDQGE